MVLCPYVPVRRRSDRPVALRPRSVGEEAHENLIGEEASAGGQAEAAVRSLEEAKGSEFRDGRSVGGVEGRAEAALEGRDVEAFIEAEREDGGVGHSGSGSLRLVERDLAHHT